MGFPLALLLIMIGVVAATGRLAWGQTASRGEKHPGTIRMYDPDAGFGLATPDEDGGDVFVHRSVLRPRGLTLKPGDRVEFRIVRGEHRDMASWLGLLRPAGP